MDEVITPTKLTDSHFDPINFLSFHIIFVCFVLLNPASLLFDFDFDFSGI
jgi:hypothetical protein